VSTRVNPAGLDRITLDGSTTLNIVTGGTNGGIGWVYNGRLWPRVSSRHGRGHSRIRRYAHVAA
jgi:hypothetical protein